MEPVILDEEAIRALGDAALCAAPLPAEVRFREIVRRAHAQAVAEVVADYGELLMLSVPQCR
jgi:hypothetical protein